MEREAQLDRDKTPPNRPGSDRRRQIGANSKNIGQFPTLKSVDVA